MRVPIAHALAHPERWESGVAGLKLAELGRLNFQAVDLRRFPCLALARDALRAGGILPNVLNAANEVAVEAFLAARLPGDESLEAILEVDAWARAAARGALEARVAAHA